MGMANRAADDALAPLISKAHHVARVLKLLSNQSRLLILCKLAASGETTVSQLNTTVGLSQSALSQHLAKLREENLVTFRRDSQTLFYSIANRQTEQLLMALKEIYCPEVEL
ncbi:MAG: metalloregulator ArsR/SmtB family transcription factor [Fimbriimonadaceae bacterium]|nr:metalloregulator ArsR/SmtB family transcription factor [Alphaproteobacteria bacterium]